MTDREINTTRIIDWPVRETSTAEEMAAFDALPYAVRAWLNFTSPARSCGASTRKCRAGAKRRDSIFSRKGSSHERSREKARLDLLAQGLVA